MRLPSSSPSSCPTAHRPSPAPNTSSTAAPSPPSDATGRQTSHIHPTSPIQRRHAMPTSSSAPEVVRRYFDLAAQPDSEAYFALFAEDATVEDEGTVYHGLAAIRAWRASVPLVQYTITNVDQTPDALVVTTIISGDF